MSVQQMDAPERSLQQRMDALKNANVIRSHRAQLKRDLKAGHISMVDLVREPHGEIESAKVFDLLLANPKYGRIKANKLLQMCRISTSKTMGGLSDRQRAEIIDRLTRRY